MRVFCNKIESQFGVTVDISYIFAEAAWFRELNIPAVCWCTLDNTLHKPNEYCVIDNVLKDTRVFAHIFLQE